MSERTRCGCVWRDERCTNRATQEDGLCNWCGNGRTPELMRDDPKATFLPDGKFMGISGGGQLHDYDQSVSRCCCDDTRQGVVTVRARRAVVDAVVHRLT
ncbi:MAG: hypothetical protein ACXVX9_15225 [Mycobacteriaceae bacterium]